jgi:predicted ATPase
LRLINLADRWAALQKSSLGREFPKNISITGELGLPAEIELPSPLTLVFGLNGAGKTRLLQAIANSFNACTVVSLSNLIYYLQRDIGIRSDINDLIDETSPLSGDKVRASQVSDLVRRDYEDVKWYVVNIVDSPFQPIVGEEIVPVFTVRHAGQEYDFRSMGLGELSAHLLMWILAYTKEGSSVPLLLDEPEAFMPSPSREVVLSYLLEETFGRSQPIVIASHSLELIQAAIDSGSAVYLSEAANVVTPIGPSPALADRVAGLFGRSAPAEWLILCEDESAYLLCEELIRAVAPRLWQSSRFLWCKGYGDLEKMWEHLPRPIRMPEGLMNFAFLADGDKLSEVSEANKKRASKARTDELWWPLFCLPGDPDVLMKNAAEPNIEWLASQLGVTEAVLQGFFERSRGREAHNWIEDIRDRLGIERQALLRVLARSFVKSATDDGALDEFKSSLRSAGILGKEEE